MAEGGCLDASLDLLASLASFNSGTGEPAPGGKTFSRIAIASPSASLAQGTITGQVIMPDYVLLPCNLEVEGFIQTDGLTGATAAARYVGATSSGAPASGTFVTGDWVTTSDGNVWICTSGGSPGTWAEVGSGSAPYPRSPCNVISGWVGSAFDPVTEVGGNFTVDKGNIYSLAILAEQTTTVSKLGFMIANTPPSGQMAGTGSIVKLTDSSGNVLGTVTSPDTAFKQNTGYYEMALGTAVSVTAGSFYYAAFLFPSTISTLPTMLVAIATPTAPSGKSPVPRWVVDGASGTRTTIPNPVPVSSYVEPGFSQPFFSLVH